MQTNSLTSYINKNIMEKDAKRYTTSFAIHVDEEFTEFSSNTIEIKC